MVWLVIFVALMIPLTAVVLDSPVVRAWVDRRQGGGGGGGEHLPATVKELAEKVHVLEAELESVNRQLTSLQDEQQFLQRLLEDPSRQHAPPPPKLPRPGA